MWMKQVGYKPRSSSMSSATSDTEANKVSSSNDNQLSGTVKRGGTSDTPSFATNSNPSSPTSPTGAAGRRRSSAGNYAGLSGLKRNSQDGKLASYMEQKPGGGGVLSGLWENFTRK
ncbi:hypothetical protein EPUS_06475 [Endocarpon pusillum Z07020]|uniref:Uncharacterized protein n=1 Tax=Endocarpon pusillum (strain Z07020 / HMAS-L-300199) TaxID=1263415 RepID=U1I1Q7_ENDPU|nr:uncharacterized protein EPUS_06475 [Endocarpon pusillum Z07020]ERF77195.1 hypothetical protein EPUS_06475 [Endocarpon pusillum Z07020]